MNKNISKTAILKGGSLTPLIIPTEFTKGLGLMNPSILKVKNKYLINIRWVGYALYHSEYKQKFQSPYGMANPSWCKINVTNCSPPGYMSACPSNPDQLGYLSIFKHNNTTIKVCSNLEYSSGKTVYIEDLISFE